MFPWQRILVLAPHTDDGELGCGATLAKFTELGKDVRYVAFCNCSKSLPQGWAPDTLVHECRNATQQLGIAQCSVLDYEVRELPDRRQDVLDELVQLHNAWRPELVLLPSLPDVHQDHQVVAQEALRAFKFCSMLGYELPWNNTRFQPNYFERIDEQHLQKKMAALAAYQSQQHRDYMRNDFVRALAVVRGIQAHAPLAEAFEIYKLIS